MVAGRLPLGLAGACGLAGARVVGRLLSAGVPRSAAACVRGHRGGSDDVGCG